MSGEIQIALRHGLATVVEAADADLIAQCRWFVSFGGSKNRPYVYGYRRVGGQRQRVSMHRLILGAQPGQMVDHIDGDGLNNRRDNLRICTNSENQANSFVGSRNSSGYKGVSYKRREKRWYAAITANGRTYSLGFHLSPIAAADAYAQAAVKLFGEFARTSATQPEPAQTAGAAA